MRNAEADDEQSLGELVARLVDDGKAYARAEINLWRAIARERGRSLVVPAALGFVALLVAQGGITALCVAIVLALWPLVGPLLAGLLALLGALLTAAALGWLAYSKVRRAWR